MTDWLSLARELEGGSPDSSKKKESTSIYASGVRARTVTSIDSLRDERTEKTKEPQELGSIEFKKARICPSRGPEQTPKEPERTDLAVDAPAPADQDEQHFPFEVRWGRERGWLQVRDCFTGEWHQVLATQCPEWWRDQAFRAKAGQSRGR